MKFQLCGPRLPSPPIDLRTTSQRAADAAQHAEQAIRRLDRGIGSEHRACDVCARHKGHPGPASTCPACAHAENRSAPDRRPPPNIPIEYSTGRGRILSVR